MTFKGFPVGGVLSGRNHVWAGLQMGGAFKWAELQMGGASNGRCFKAMSMTSNRSNGRILGLTSCETEFLKDCAFDGCHSESARLQAGRLSARRAFEKSSHSIKKKKIAF